MVFDRFLKPVREDRALRVTCPHETTSEWYDGIGATYQVCRECGHKELVLD